MSVGLFVKLDVRFPDDDKIVDAGLDGAGLYAMALCKAKHLLSDGRLTRGQLYRVGASDDLIDRLVTLGLFTADAGDAVRITAWDAHHAPASEVIGSDKGGRLAHVRWHEKKGVQKPGCAWCFPAKPLVNADECDAGCDADAMRDAEHAMPETETETDPPLSQSDFTTLADTVCQRIGEEDHLRAVDEGRVQAVTDHGRRKHLEACQASAAARHHADAERLIRAGATVDEVVARLGAPTPPPSGPGLAEPSPTAIYAAADQARQARDAQAVAEAEAADPEAIADARAAARAALTGTEVPA